LRSTARLVWRTAAAGDVRGGIREAFYAGVAMVPGGDARYERWRHPERLTVGPATGIVVEGYPGSANTWVSVVIGLANPNVQAARHRHRAAQAIEGIRRRIPVLLLVRDPVDAVASIIVRQPDRRSDVELARYEAFYRACLPVADKVVVATFEQATTDVDSVIRTLNEQFGTVLRGLSDLAPDGRGRVVDSIRTSDEYLLGSRSATSGALPDGGRDGHLIVARHELRDTRHARALGRCNELFWHYAALAGRRVREDAGSPLRIEEDESYVH
jgi:hypothetical protein